VSLRDLVAAIVGVTGVSFDYHTICVTLVESQVRTAPREESPGLSWLERVQQGMAKFLRARLQWALRAIAR